MKRFLYSVGVAALTGYAYYRGYRAGFEMNPLVEEVDVDKQEGLDDAHSEGSETNVACKDDDCSETFDTERGMKIHYGQIHTSDD